MKQTFSVEESMSASMQAITSSIAVDEVENPSLSSKERVARALFPL